MRWLFNAAICILIELLGIVINIANAFLTNIVIYEATSGFSFDWSLLISNRIFWITLVIQLAYGIITICVHIKNKNSDGRLVEAIEDKEIELLSQVVVYSEKGDFDSANKVIKILDKFEKRRKKLYVINFVQEKLNKKN